MALQVRGLEHYTLVSNDVERSKRFYVDVLGAAPVERDFPPCVVLGGTSIDIFAATGDEKPSPGPLNQHHAFRIPLEDYDAWVDHFKARDVPIYLASHGNRRMSIYVQDPDGYHVELTAVLEDDEQGRRELEKRGIAHHRNPSDPRNRA